MFGQNWLRINAGMNAHRRLHPIANTGIALHAATGAVSVQAQSDKISVAAQQNIRMVSTQGNAHVQGKQQVLLNVQGAAIRLAGGDIEINAPGAVTFKAQQHKLTGPQSDVGVKPVMGKGELKLCDFKMAAANVSNDALVSVEGRYERCSGASSDNGLPLCAGQSF